MYMLCGVLLFYNALHSEIEQGIKDEVDETPNEKSLKEKKKKLLDNLSRLIKYFVRQSKFLGPLLSYIMFQQEKEDAKKAADIKRCVLSLVLVSL